MCAMPVAIPRGIIVVAHTAAWGVLLKPAHTSDLRIMLTGPVAAARAVVATGAWVESKHDMYLIRGSVGA